MKKVFFITGMLCTVITYAAGMNLDIVQGTPNQLCFENVHLNNFTDPLVYATPHNAYESNVVTVDTSDNCLTVYANRDNSNVTRQLAESELAAEGVSWTSANMTTYSSDDSGTPKELNFFALGNLSLNYNHQDYECDNIMFAQGHTGAENNWWAMSNINYSDVSKNMAPNGIEFGNVVMQCTYESNNQSYSTFLVLQRTLNDHSFTVQSQQRSPVLMNAG